MSVGQVPLVVYIKCIFDKIDACIAKANERGF